MAPPHSYKKATAGAVGRTDPQKHQGHGSDCKHRTPLERYHFTLINSYLRRNPAKSSDYANNPEAVGRQIVAEWEKGNLPKAAFLGQNIRHSIHSELAAKLKQAEDALRRAYPGLADVELRRVLGITEDLHGIRAPKDATGGEQVSMHCYGLAIDIEYTGNPFIQRKDKAQAETINRASLLLTGRPIHLTQPPPSSDPGELGEDYDLASQALKEYVAFADSRTALEQHLASLSDQAKATLRSQSLPSDLDFWSSQIKTDISVLEDGRGRGKGAFRHHHPRKGFYTLNEDLLDALVQVGLYWGGLYQTGRDLMHFDWRDGSIVPTDRE